MTCNACTMDFFKKTMLTSDLRLVTVLDKGWVNVFALPEHITLVYAMQSQHRKGFIKDHRYGRFPLVGFGQHSCKEN